MSNRMGWLAVAAVVILGFAAAGTCSPTAAFDTADIGSCFGKSYSRDLLSLSGSSANRLPWQLGSAATSECDPGMGAEVNAHASSQYGNLPLSFVENGGQLNSAVRYVIRGPQASTFFTDTGVTFELYSHSATASRATLPVSGAVLRMEFEGADPGCRPEGIDELPGKVNYLTGNESSGWHTDIPTYAGVRYQNVWPGIDVSYHGAKRQLKYDIRVAPEADISQIRLRYSGAQKLWLDGRGDLHVQTAVTTFVERVPGIYQEISSTKQTLRGGYVLLDDQTVGFRVAGRDPEASLVIDPASDLVYSTYLGGSDYDCALAIALDSSGCAYVAGWTWSSDFPTTVGAFQRTYPNSYNYNSYNSPDYYYDAFVAKLNAGGTGLVYSTYLGGQQLDWAYCIAVDSTGCAYVAGYTDSSDFPTTHNAYQARINSGSYDGFITKLNATGSALMYSTCLGGSNYDYVASIAVDSSGCAYAQGNTESSDFPTTTGAFQRTLLGNEDAFVTKLNANGSALVYSTLLGGSYSNYGSAVALDPSGCAYVAGSTGSSDFPTTSGALQTRLDGWEDAFVTKLNSSGTALAYSTFLGGVNYDCVRSIDVDTSGCAYVAGSTASFDFPTTAGAFQRGRSGDNAFVTKLSASGSALVYSTCLGGSSDEAYAIAVDSSGCAYVAGYAASSDFPTSPGAYQGTLDGYCDAFVTKLNAGGTGLIYSSYLGGGNYDYAYAIAIDTSGCAYVAGSTASSDFPTTSGAFRRTYSGIYSTCFVSKLSMYQPTISAAKTSIANTQLTLPGSVVTAAFSDGSFYVEDPSRSSGIRVSGASLPKVGDLIQLAGTLIVSNGEAQLSTSTWLKIGKGSVRPIGIPAKLLGGGPVGLQAGIAGAPKPNNFGLLVYVWGKVTEIGSGCLYIDDGSNWIQGYRGGDSAHIGVLVICDPSNYTKGDLLCVTGINSCYTTAGGQVAPRILTRGASDIRRY